jgi:hypothetical protein
MALALTQSLLQEGRCDAAAAAAACGAAFDPKRAYRQFDRNVYQALKDGDDYRETSARWEGWARLGPPAWLPARGDAGPAWRCPCWSGCRCRGMQGQGPAAQHTQQRRTAPHLQLHARALPGATACNCRLPPLTANACQRQRRRYLLAARGAGGVARVHPLGLAYRGASPELLQQATDAALLCSHNYAEGLDAARVQAAAVGWLACREPGQPGCSPSALLEHLGSLAQFERLRKSLKLMRLWVSVAQRRHTLPPRMRRGVPRQLCS